MNIIITAAVFGGIALCPIQVQPAMSETTTVDGVDYPVCGEEDCSDQPGQVGVWFDPDTGNAWLSLGAYSVPVIR